MGGGQHHRAAQHPPAAGTRTGAAPGPPAARDPRFPQPRPWSRPWLRPPPPPPCLSFPLRSTPRPSAWPRETAGAWHGLGRGQHPQGRPREHPQPAAPGHSPRASCQYSRCACAAGGLGAAAGDRTGSGTETSGCWGAITSLDGSELGWLLSQCHHPQQSPKPLPGQVLSSESLRAMAGATGGASAQGGGSGQVPDHAGPWP